VVAVSFQDRTAAIDVALRRGILHHG